MIEQKLYICEYCNTQFKSKSAAQICENNHHKPKEIKSAKYHQASCSQDGYPDSIEIKFTDGTVKKYKK